MHAAACVERSEEDSLIGGGPLPLCGPRDQTPVVKLGGKCPYLLSRFANSLVIFYRIFFWRVI